MTTLRSAENEDAQIRARANARLALSLAIAELQKQAGDDRRITADGDLVDGREEPNAVGVWNSWSPKFSADPRQTAPNYESEKDDSFRRWLVSGLDSDELEDPNWASSGTTGENFELFRETSDGFSLRGGTIPVGAEDSPGSYAWAVSQEATKAKVNVAVNSDEIPNLDPNDQLHAPYRPNLEITSLLGEATGDFTRRSQTVINPQQLKLDPEMWQGDTSINSGRHFTTRSMGLLTNVVDGGLKTDMNLGFELSDIWFGEPGSCLPVDSVSRISRQILSELCGRDPVSGIVGCILAESRQLCTSLSDMKGVDRRCLDSNCRCWSRLE
jgi:hypothetical protein